MLVALVTLLAASPPWQAGPSDGTVASRFAPPPGHVRVVAAERSFAAWLRALPLRPGRPEVRLFDGSPKENQRAQAAVLAVEVGRRDLQQCADAVMRLRAEYLRDHGRADEVCFRFTSGDPASFRAWRDGVRPRVDGNRVRFVTAAARSDASYASFRAYLDVVFTYAGSASLARELLPVAAAEVEGGDVLIQGGHPGHAVIVVDVAADAEGRRAVLLAQSYMPAQELHVLVGPNGERDGWYPVRGEHVATPEWRFRWSDLERFPDASCR